MQFKPFRISTLSVLFLAGIKFGGFGGFRQNPPNQIPAKIFIKLKIFKIVIFFVLFRLLKNILTEYNLNFFVIRQIKYPPNFPKLMNRQIKYPPKLASRPTAKLSTRQN